MVHLAVGIGRNPLRLPLLLKQIYEKKKGRGMSYVTDVRDWLGGWPMEFADDQAVVDFLKEKFDFRRLVRMSTGEACCRSFSSGTQRPGQPRPAKAIPGKVETGFPSGILAWNKS